MQLCNPPTTSPASWKVLFRIFFLSAFPLHSCVDAIHFLAWKGRQVVVGGGVALGDGELFIRCFLNCISRRLQIFLYNDSIVSLVCVAWLWSVLVSDGWCENLLVSPPHWTHCCCGYTNNHQIKSKLWLSSRCHVCCVSVIQKWT